MGVVYLASLPSDDVVAVKVIQVDLGEAGAIRARFCREVDAARRVGGVCTARVRDADLEGERPWVVTDFLAGRNLADLVARHGSVAADQQLALAVGLAEALSAVHAAGVVHRDLKPTNVLCSGDGPRLIDFGIAQAADATSATLTGQLVGSPSWMAPEQIRGQQANPAMVLFALGSVLVFAATGRPPFGEGQMETVMYRIVNEEPDLGPPGAIAAPLAPLVESLLAKDPAARPGLSRRIIGDPAISVSREEKLHQRSRGASACARRADTLRALISLTIWSLG
jgi:serine/threonine protein kinase